MNRINTVGELRAVLAGLPDDTLIRPAMNRYAVAAPGLYVIRYAEGTCSAAYVEVQEATHTLVANFTTCAGAVAMGLPVFETHHLVSPPPTSGVTASPGETKPLKDADD
jgi:hypothetical protein